MTKNMMDYATVIAVGKLIEAHCLNNGNGAVYEEGWSDDRIVTEIGGITKFNVIGVRERLFGKLARTKPESIEDRLLALELWAGERPKCPFKRSV